MTRLPTLFVSHGAPTFALAPGLSGPQLSALGASLPRPRAVLVVSPHWTTHNVRVGTVDRPETVHDFGGFPPALYQLQYPAPGAPEIAQRTLALLQAAGWPTAADPGRGLDHGAWVPLRYLYPDASVPVFQVSMPAQLDAQGAWRLGRSLAPLAGEGVLIVGSGSLTHNLYEFRSGDSAEPAYAREFVNWVREAVRAHDAARLLRTLEIAPSAQRAHPTAEHFLPLLVAYGASDEGGEIQVLDGGFAHGVLAMESYVFGAMPPATEPAAILESAHV
ncbi:dioxygenase [Xylophilus rhododendri]|uniref:Dioxygenase n=1 Tax=Xylophilus rhododendri TaxID=2697032 RepID=A0A857J519_9BURK|nr:class III extradiol ring-cleavage dioxygenase [Xylophilus rhododendri]QHI98111.1 dioxygenase [Xylophilus rhododendri]